MLVDVASVPKDGPGTPVARVQLAMAAMADGVLVADTRSGAVSVNPAARTMLGIPPDVEVTTAYLKDEVGFYPFDLVVAAHGDGTAVREEVRIGDRVLHSVVTPLVEHGQPTGAVVVLRDLGETRELSRRRSEFAQLMSHELRTPLTSVAGALDIVLSGYAGPLTEKQHRYIEMARIAATRMNLLVDQLLDLARAQAGSITVQLTALHLDKLARSVVERYRETARVKQLRIDVVTTAEGIGILGDPDRLAQVLGNLLSNSIKFAPPGGTIDVEVFGPPLLTDAVGVSVHNEGAPIAEDERERIFEPFSASGRRVGGTGLGLSISRSIVEAHGGKIWVESGERGTRFVFTLPAKPHDAKGVPVAVGPHGTMPPPMEIHPTATRARSREATRVLVVDDDRRRALLLKGVLMADGDDVRVTEDADSALAAARADHPGLIVVSAAVPDAHALLAILEHDPDTRKSAVLAMSDPGAAADLIAAGADEVIDLPLAPAALREACVRVLEAGRREAPRIMVIDDDAAIRAICREVLEQAGFEVKDVATSHTAVAEARRFRPDLVLMDVMMPVLDGFRTAEQLRKDTTTGLTPIIFLSAKGDTADKVRAFRSGAEDYMVKPFDAAELVARVGKALDRQARELGASPTTQLPGADAIQAEIERRLGIKDDAVTCYLDLDNLKALNDYYGYAKADAVIRQTGDLVRDCVARVGSPGDFIGHIAGDDFVLVTSRDRADAVCTAICQRFDRLIPLYYDREDRSRGYIETTDRWGELRQFPMMSVSIAGVSMQGATYADLAERAAAGKHKAKALPGSTYVRDGVVVHDGRKR
jgi:signal transduction histidine kinase/DNA-binding response OmpR family regulator